MTTIEIPRQSFFRRLLPGWRRLLGEQPAVPAPVPAPAAPIPERDENQVGNVYRSQRHDHGEDTTALGRAAAEHLIVRRPDLGDKTRLLSEYLDRFKPPTTQDDAGPAPSRLSALERALLEDTTWEEAAIYNRLSDRWRLANGDNRDHSGDVVPLPPIPQPSKEVDPS